MPFLNDKERENSLNEIRIIASVKHPNIIGYKECFFDQDQKVLCVIMEHADMGDLLQKIRKSKENKSFLPESAIWNIFIQIVQALKALHDNNIVHRDMKSANILLCANGRVKLADFNVSKIVKNKMTQTQIGTPFYASPEIWNYVPYDFKSDIWSLGCIVYEMCCLRTPFQGSDMKSICKKVCRGQYQKIPAIYSYELSSFINQMLQLNPDDRPDSERILLDPFVLNHIRHSHNQTYLFSTISENNFELLSTIQWSTIQDIPDAKNNNKQKRKHPQKPTRVRELFDDNKKSNSNNNNLDDFFSVKLPPPLYTPESGSRKRRNFSQYVTLDHNSPVNRVQLNSLQPEVKNQNVKNSQKRIINKNKYYMRNQNSKSLDEGSGAQKEPYNQFMEDKLIQVSKEIDKSHSQKPMVQLKPLSFQNSSRKLQVRTETSQSKRLNLFSHQDSNDSPSKKSMVRSQNSISNITEHLMPPLNTKIKQKVDPSLRVNRLSIQEKPNDQFVYLKKQQEIYSSFERPKNENSKERPKKHIQIKQIIDLLQGNPLKPVARQNAPKNSLSQPKQTMKQEVLNQTLIRENLEEMKSIKNQMQDISRLIQHSINQNQRKDKMQDILKK